jgi:hypothetical protein
MKIAIREFKPEDMNFILDAWIKSAYSNITGYKERKSVFHKGMESIIKRKLSDKSMLVFVACEESEPDFILWFAAFGTDYSLHYVFVKEVFKKIGVSKMLLSNFYKNKKEITVSHWCDGLKHIKGFDLEYNRFKFFN